jgi:hypothetical protein
VVADAPPADVEPVKRGGDFVALVVHGEPPALPRRGRSPDDQRGTHRPLDRFLFRIPHSLPIFPLPWSWPWI